MNTQEPNMLDMLDRIGRVATTAMFNSIMSADIEEIPTMIEDSGIPGRLFNPALDAVTAAIEEGTMACRCDACVRRVAIAGFVIGATMRQAVATAAGMAEAVRNADTATE